MLACNWRQVTREFQSLIQRCSPELRARQRVLTERRGDLVFVQIITSFRVEAKPEEGKRTDLVDNITEVTKRAQKKSPPTLGRRAL